MPGIQGIASAKRMHARAQAIAAHDCSRRPDKLSALHRSRVDEEAVRALGADALERWDAHAARMSAEWGAR